jgi:hypothetical protein
VKYNQVKFVGNKVALQDSNVGLSKSIKKSNNLTIQEEWLMLARLIYQPTSLVGFNLRFGYFYI